MVTQAGDLAVRFSDENENKRVVGTTAGRVTDSIFYHPGGDVMRYLVETKQGTGDVGTTIYDVVYHRDELGRIVDRTETIGGVTSTRTYLYWPRGFLWKAVEDGVEYRYDDNGNRLDPDAEYDAQDRQRRDGDRTYEYGPNGDLRKITRSQSATEFHYDVRGQLRWVLLPSGERIDYLIDPMGRRAGKALQGAQQEWFVYRGSLQPVLWKDAGGAVCRFVYASDRNVPDYMVRNGERYRLITDERGSVRLVVRMDAPAVPGGSEIVQRIDYDVWGNVLADTNPGFQPFGFAGGIYDQDTRLVRLGARDYDPETGRWTTKDPLLFAGGDTNLYLYAGGDPVNRIDPSGLVVENGWTEWNRREGERLTAAAALAWRDGINWTAMGYVARGRASLESAVSLKEAAFFNRPDVMLALSFGPMAVVGEGTEAAAGIGATGRIGEVALQELGGEPQVFFRTSQGGRFVDQLVNRVAHESKVGYQSLTPTLARQIAKDAELVGSRQLRGALWHFFESPVTGKIGPSGPLRQALKNAGIGVEVHW